MQALNFILAKILQDKIPRLRLKARRIVPHSSCNKHSQRSSVDVINTHVNHVCIDLWIINNNDSKANKCLVPLRMWGDRFRLAFSGRDRIGDFIKGLRTLGLHCCWWSLLTSLMCHIEQKCSLETVQALKILILPSNCLITLISSLLKL